MHISCIPNYVYLYRVMDNIREIMSYPIFSELFTFVLAITMSILLVDQVKCASRSNNLNLIFIHIFIHLLTDSTPRLNWLCSVPWFDKTIRAICICLHAIQFWKRFDKSSSTLQWCYLEYELVRAWAEWAEIHWKYYSTIPNSIHHDWLRHHKLFHGCFSEGLPSTHYFTWITK